MFITYHLVPQSYFDAQDARAYYRAHLEPFYYLTIDTARVRAKWRYDDAAKKYPHIYGALNRDAIIAIQPARRAADGTFMPPEEMIE
ncbi:MAG: DUF952 domain-containing protein [Chloroflexi bacterium]|nr:DUF952 domain-containing protein [Chloroflexota bacterium]